LPNLDFEIGKHPNAAEVAPHRLRSPLDISWRERIGLATEDLFGRASPNWRRG
jgi:hypothetical protein